MKKTNAKEEIEFRIMKEINTVKAQLVVTTETNLFNTGYKKVTE